MTENDQKGPRSVCPPAFEIFVDQARVQQLFDTFIFQFDTHRHFLGAFSHQIAFWSVSRRPP
jgi:hypothetical protein